MVHRISSKVLLSAAVGSLIGMLALGAGSEGVAHSASTPAPATQPDDVGPISRPTMTRLYDVRDLMAEFPDFPAAGDLGSEPRPQGAAAAGNSLYGSSGVTSDAEKNSEQLIEKVTKVMEASVTRDDWKDAGGAIATVTAAEGILIVTHTAEGHRQLETFFKDWRRFKGATLRVRAHWVLCDHSELKVMLKPVLIGPGDAPDGIGGALQSIDLDDLDRVPHARAHYKSELLCMNGQRASVQGIHSQTVAARLVPLVDRASEFVPDCEDATSGSMLDVQAILTPERRAADLTLRADWTAIRKHPARDAIWPSTRPSSGPSDANTSTEVILDHPEYLVHHIHTSFRLPLGKMILVGGAPLDATEPPAATRPSGGAEALPHSDPQLYLFIEVTKA